MDQEIVSSKVQNMIERAATNIPIRMKKYKPQEGYPIFFVSKEDMKKFISKELVIMKSTEEGGGIYEEIGTSSGEFTLRACKNFQFRVYPGKRISKKKRVAVGGIAGAMAGGATGVAAGGAAGTGAGAAVGAAVGGGAGAIHADYKKQKRAVIVTVEDAFKWGIGYHQDENFVYCTVINDGF